MKAIHPLLRLATVVSAVAIVLLLISGCGFNSASPTPNPLSVSIASVEGSGFANNPSEDDWMPLSAGLFVSSGGQIYSSPGSLVRVDLPDSTQLFLGPSTLVRFELTFENRTRIMLVEGQFWIIPGSGSVQVDTKYGVGFELNAYLSARYYPAEDVVIFTCMEGSCQVGNQGGSLTLLASQSAWLYSDTSIAPMMKAMTQEELVQWQRFDPEIVVALDETAPTSQKFALLAGTATQIALTESYSLTATATALGDVTALPTSLVNTPQPTYSAATSFSKVIGPTAGTISTCVHSYYVDAQDPDGISYIKVEHSLSPNFNNSISIKLTNIWDKTWAEPRIFETTANPGTDTVYWRFWALDNLGNITYQPASGSYSYKDPLDCGGPVKFAKVVGPKSGEIAQCKNYYSVDIVENAADIFSLKIEYAFNANMNNSKWLSVSRSGITWSGTHLIDTSGHPGATTVYWRFWVRTYNHGNDIYYNPSAGTYAYVDKLNCGGPAPTAVPSLVPSNTPTLPAVTFTATIISTLAPTLVPSATATQPASPTATQVASPTATNTPTSSATAAPTATSTPTPTPTATPLP